ncbi:sensor histidine kinase [Catenovulum maritimum]|uniref:histidine kinase n=1 Tax=Catenovulum maritimum TaxID=1513271 RepID=A0A0J8GQS6_9ALTE|nr:HAMP domain-containing sensor histidine kinase [Catenovulum maritimum]KMT65067.1 hypothetical protein XM47_11405 [Catenovulum maritimum]
MFRSLSSQLAIIIGALFLIAAFGLFQWYFHSSEQFADEVEQSLHRDLAAHIVHDDINLNQGIIKKEKLKSAFHTQMLLGPEWEFYAVDTLGNILAYSAPEGVVKLSKIDLSPIKQYLNTASFPLYGDDPRTPGTHKIFSASEIHKADGSLAGYLYVIIGGQKRDSAEAILNSSKVLKDGALILGSAIIFGLIALMLAVNVITKPLKKLSERSLEYVANDFTNLKTEHQGLLASKEIHDLETSFVSAAQHINDQLAKIKTTEQLRRELLSHISHDFRTPLTALNGYLETWLISPEEKRSPELIEIALKNGNQISQLVDQLFELARLESGDIKFIPEAVNVVELAYDVIQRLRYQAEQRGVSLSVESPNSGIIANADISKLERILVNLIDNAIRHTEETGEVKVVISPQPESIELSIKDNGKGIPDDELNQIFDAKFQATNTSSSIKNAGLGLSIVKHLLDMHMSRVEVKSEQGKGSQFSFLLPFAKLT